MENGISKKQAQVAHDVVFTSGDKTTGEILKEHGVTAEEYSGWLREGSYVGYLCTLSESAAEGDRPRLMRKLAELAAGGDTKAIKMFLDILSESGSGQLRISAPQEITPREDIEELKREIWGDGT